jgi:hypothetical protein
VVFHSKFVQTTLITVIMAISEGIGVIHTQIVEGSVDSPSNEYFLIEMHKKLYPITVRQKRQTSVICDNAIILQRIFKDFFRSITID